MSLGVLIGGCTRADARAPSSGAIFHASANWIRSQVYHVDPYPGPMAGTLLLIPPVISAGLGELGKHGSLISPRFGAGVRLAGVTTDLPLVPARPIQGSDAPLCTRCKTEHFDVTVTTSGE
jgi:epoxyqueuosine reductase